MADYIRSTISQGNVISPETFLNLQDGIEEIIRTKDSLKQELLSILKDKDITASESESISDLLYHFQDLKNDKLNSSENTDDIIDIRKTVKSGQIQFVYLDGASVAFSVNTYTTDKLTQTATGTYQIDWGDGTVETITNNQNWRSHTFKSGSGTKYDSSHNQHVVTVTPVDCSLCGINCNGQNNLLAVAAKDVFFIQTINLSSCGKLKYFDLSGGSIRINEKPNTLANAFDHCYNLVRISGPVCWSAITSLDYAFRDCNSLVSFDLGDVWNTENCTSFNWTFNQCYKLEQAPGMNTEKAISFTGVYCNCNSLKNINCDFFNLESATGSLAWVFRYCYVLPKIPKLLNTGQVNSFDNAFSDCRSLTKLSQDVLDTSGASQIQYMFKGCSSLEEAPEMDFNSVTTDALEIFSNCTSLYITQKTFNFASLIGSSPNIANGNIGNGIDGMFYNCTSLTSAPEINAPYVLSARLLFNGCLGLVSLPKKYSFPELLMAYKMFYGCSAMITAPAELDFPKVKNVSNLFAYCTNLTTAPSPNGKLNFPSLTSCGEAFKECISLVNIPNEIDLGSATSIYQLFYNCSSLKTFPTLILTGVTDVNSAFYGCNNVTDLRGKTLTLGTVSAQGLFQNLTQLLYPYDEINLPNATNISYLFSGSTSMIQAPKQINAPKATNCNNMFDSCRSVVEIPDYHFPSAVSCNSFVNNCSSLEKIGTISTDADHITFGWGFALNASSLIEFNAPVCKNGSVTISNSYVSGNTVLRTINGELDMSSGVGFTDLFPDSLTTLVGKITLKSLKAALTLKNKTKLTEVRLVNPNSNMANLTIMSCGLETEALNNLMTDLPTITNGSTLKITGNPGSATCDTTIATKKGWKVVYQ